MSPVAGRLRGLLRSPAVHFLALGAVATLLVPDARPAIVLDPTEVARLRADWTAGRAREPTASEEGTLLERAVDDEILLREAWASGLDEGDAIVARRLARVGSFLGRPEEDPSDAEAWARELGLHRSDVVVRRYLIEMMRLAIARESDRELPTEAELEAHRRAQRARFEVPERLRLSHVFVSARRGGAAGPDARRILDELRAGESRGSRGPESGHDRGDPFPHGATLVASARDLGRSFGAGFADRLDPARVGEWQGPIPSAYGLHLVRIHERIPARLPDLEEIRGQVVHHALRVRREAHLRRRLDALRERYEIVLEARGT